MLKRSFDIMTSGLAVLLLSPLLLPIAIALLLTGEGEIIYRQERIGRYGRPFSILKFATMLKNSPNLPGGDITTGNDPRILPVGGFLRRTKINELPQLLNILKGDMSIVGPRPERQFFIDQITKIAPHYRHLHRVRPGLTSLGQVKYGYAETVAQMVERLKFDILYIENMSLAMDFRVLLYTLKIIMEGRGK